MKPLVPVGEFDGVPLFYYPAIALYMLVGRIASQGGFVYPGITIEYSPEDLPGVLRIVRLMESQGRKPEVYLEPVADRLEAAVLFKVSVGIELAAHILTEGSHTIDLGQLGSGPKMEFMATAETDVDLEGVADVLPWFKAQRFRVIICKGNPLGIEEIFWQIELDSYEEKLPEIFDSFR